MSPGHNGCLCDLDPRVPYEVRGLIARSAAAHVGLGDRFHRRGGGRAIASRRSMTAHALRTQPQKVETTAHTARRPFLRIRPTGRSWARTRCPRANARRSGSRGRPAAVPLVGAQAAAAAGGGAQRLRTQAAGRPRAPAAICRDTDARTPRNRARVLPASPGRDHGRPVLPGARGGDPRGDPSPPGSPVPTGPRPRGRRGPQPVARRQRLRVARELPGARALWAPHRHAGHHR